MRNVLILIPILLFLAGCSSSGYRPAHVDFIPATSTQAGFPAAQTSTFQVEDKRASQEVVVYQSGKSAPLAIDAEPPLSIILEDRLGAGFRQQGLNITRASAVHIVVTINTLQAVVAKNKGFNQVTAATDISLQVDTPQKSLTKNFTRSADRKSLRSPKLSVIEQMLREQLKEISELILADTEIKTTILKGNQTE